MLKEREWIQRKMIAIAQRWGRVHIMFLKQLSVDGLETWYETVSALVCMRQYGIIGHFDN